MNVTLLYAVGALYQEEHNVSAFCDENVPMGVSGASCQCVLNYLAVASVRRTSQLH